MLFRIRTSVLAQNKCNYSSKEFTTLLEPELNNHTATLSVQMAPLTCGQQVTKWLTSASTLTPSQVCAGLYCTLYCLYVYRMKQCSHDLSASQQTNRRNNEDPNNTRVIASDTSILDFSVVVASSTDSVGVAVDTDRGGGGGGAMSRVQGCLFKRWVDRIVLKVHLSVSLKSRECSIPPVYGCVGGWRSWGLFKSVNVVDRFMV